MVDNIANNERIARNTVFLYIRMLVIMAISLFTSRVVLNTLGVDDFGIYNVVSGVVVLFTFVNSAMTTGTQRHISYELGKSDGRVSIIFSACLKIHVILGVLVVVLGELIGLWFLNYQLNIPCKRMSAANIIYQIAIINCFVSVIKTPYNASIIAYEKMSFYSYMSIFDAVSKLLLVYLLLVIPFDKLITYASSICIANILSFFIYVFYAHIKFKEIRLVRITDKGLYRYLLSFSGWTLFGSVTNMLETQGLNMIINIFYGVTLNAAVGIANQVRGVISQFVAGFQQALNPQLVMSESSGDRTRQFSLIFHSAKFSFFIMYALSLPVITNLYQLLFLWLGQVPDYTVPICILVIILQLFECMSSPLYTTIFAIGKIRSYQICVCMFRMTSVIAALLICRFGAKPYMIYLMPCIVASLLLVYRIWYIYKEVGMPVMSFILKVIVPVFNTCSVTIIPLIVYKHTMQDRDSVIGLIFETIAIIIFTFIIIFIIGLTSSERITILKQINKVINR